jgi:hypothetical protein
MKKLIYIITLFSLSFFANAQDEQKKIVVSNDKLNEFYANTYNPISVCVEGYDNKDLIICSNAGEIGGDNDSKYFSIGHDFAGRNRIHSIFIMIYTKNELGDTIFIGEKKFRLIGFPPPEVSFGSKKEGFISKGEIMIVAGLSCIEGNYYYHESKCKVTKYDFIILNKDLDTVYHRFSRELHYVVMLKA